MSANVSTPEDYSSRPGTQEMRERMVQRAREVGVYVVGDPEPPKTPQGRNTTVVDLARVQTMTEGANATIQGANQKKLQRLPEILEIAIEEPSKFVQIRYKGEIVTLAVPPVKLEDGQLLGWYQDQIGLWTTKVRESVTEDEAKANNAELFKWHTRQIRMMVPDITDDMMHAIHGRPYRQLSEYIAQAAMEELGLITDDMYDEADPKGGEKVAS